MSEWKLDPKIKKQWLKALRSGAYDKGTGTLVESDSDGRYAEWCCLGVYANEFLEEEWRAFSSCSSRAFRCRHSVAGYTGSISPEHIPDEIQADLISLNDQNLTFEPVIKYIEKHL